MGAGNISDVTEAQAKSGYLPFVDGLRAMAILLVVLYHAGVPWLPGGFVGVDVFFVISGYLIIGQIAAAMNAGSFSYVEFWSRRAIRILPPYALVLAATMLAAPLVLFLPDELQDFGYEVGASAIFQANHFYLGEQGYFERGAETRLLLHLWSLAVEEQFYIVTPLAMAVVWWVARHAGSAGTTGAPAIGAVLLCVSLAGCILFTGVDGARNHAFFLMPLRAWEFLAGAAAGVLLPQARRFPRSILELIAAAGLACIIAAGLGFSSQTHFPSWNAALPVTGALAVLIACLANSNIAAARLLSLRVATAIGLISYSWYLWHWPVLTMARMNRFGERDLVADLGYAAVALGLAVATYLAVERPLRDWRHRRHIDWRPGIAAVAGCVALGVIGLGGYSAGSTLQANAAEKAGIQEGLSADQKCFIASLRSIDECSRPHDRYGIIIGDSQAESVTPVLQRFARDRAHALLAATGGACPPLVGADVRIPDVAMADNCARTRSALQRMIAEASLTPSFAILVSRWQIYVDPDSAYTLVDDATGDRRPPIRLAAELRSTIETLHTIGVRRILLIGPSPEFEQPAPRCVNLSDRAGMDRDLKCSLPRALVDDRNATANDWIAAAASDFDFVRVVDPTGSFCDAQRCRSFSDQHVYFRDGNHLSDAGIRAILEHAREDFDWVLPQKPNEGSS